MEEVAATPSATERHRAGDERAACSGTGRRAAKIRGIAVFRKKAPARVTQSRGRLGRGGRDGPRRRGRLRCARVSRYRRCAVCVCEKGRAGSRHRRRAECVRKDVRTAAARHRRRSVCSSKEVRAAAAQHSGVVLSPTHTRAHACHAARRCRARGRGLRAVRPGCSPTGRAPRQVFRSCGRKRHSVRAALRGRGLGVRPLRQPLRPGPARGALRCAMPRVESPARTTRHRPPALPARLVPRSSHTRLQRQHEPSCGARTGTPRFRSHPRPQPRRVAIPIRLWLTSPNNNRRSAHGLHLDGMHTHTHARITTRAR